MIAYNPFSKQKNKSNTCLTKSKIVCKIKLIKTVGWFLVTDSDIDIIPSHTNQQARMLPNTISQ